MVNGIRKIYGDGSVCILTSTNMEALQVMGLLKKYGIRAKLIQSNDNFDLYNLAEIRIFLKRIEKNLSTPVIDEESWEDAKNAMVTYYKNSANLELCLKMLEAFELANRKKYKSDFELFLHESRLFYNGNLFDKFITEDVSFFTDYTFYEKPDEILVQLTHRDLYLDFFKKQKPLINRTISGEKLLIREKGLSMEYSGSEYPIILPDIYFRRNK